MPTQAMLDREDRAIQWFCDTVSKETDLKCSIASRPDREGVPSGCDAIVIRGSESLAVEHTSFDTFPNQRRDSAWFLEVMAPLEQSISSAFPELPITLGIHCNVIQPGSDWESVRQAILEECMHVIPSLPPEQSIEIKSDRIPFPVAVNRGPIEFGNGSFVVRFSPQDKEFTLAEEMRVAIKRKREKIQCIKNGGGRTVLLLDGDDFALTNDQILSDAFAFVAAGEDLAAFDEIYLIDSRSTRNRPLVLPMKLNAQIVPDLPEYQVWERNQLQASLKHYSG